MKYDARRRRENLFRREKKRGPLVPISLVIIAATILLLSLVNPLQIIGNFNPANVRVPPPTPTSTPLPRPTSIQGGHIVFTCTRKDINQICLINGDGSGFRQLTDGTQSSYYPALSPDSEHVVFAGLKYGNFEIFSLRLSDSNLDQLTEGIGNVVSPDFSPDGKQLVFVNRVGEKPSALWIMQSDGKNPRLLYAGPRDIVSAAWSPDGSKIAFAMSVDSPFAYQIFILDLRQAGPQPRRLSPNLASIGGSLDWAPNSMDLLIFAGPVAAREIYRLEAAHGSAAQLTYSGSNASGAYSPDGQYIVFNSLRNGQPANLFVMRADGHSTRQLTDDAEPDWQPKWGP